MQRLREVATEHGRSGSDLRIVVDGVMPDAAQLEPWAAIGAHARFAACPPSARRRASRPRRAAARLVDTFRSAEPQELPPMTDQPDLSFDPMDQTKTKDWAFLARLRETCPVSQPNEHLVFTATFAETRQGFRDATRLSSVGDMATGVVVVAEEGELPRRARRPLHCASGGCCCAFTSAACGAAEDWTCSARRRLRPGRTRRR